MSDIPWGAIASGVGAIGKGVNSYASAGAANDEIQRAYEQMLANLKERFGDYDALGSAGYSNITPQQLGPSALEGIPEDLQSRQAQQESIAKLEELAANGGLSLADMKALNDIQRNLNQNNSARQQGLANQFAARGQLGSGAQMAMGLANTQNAAESANQQGESTAAQAQARALQAILQKGTMARSMGNDDYSRKAAAAQAHDMIEARNAAARTDAGKYNNSLAGQNFDDQLHKAQGKTALTDSLNRTVFGKGTANANTIKGRASGINSDIDGATTAFSKFGSGGGSDTSGNTTVDEGVDTDEPWINENDDD